MLLREHWQFESGLYGQLAVSMREDAAGNRKDDSPTNIVALRRRALDVACTDASKGSMAGKIQRAGWTTTSC